jgi:hypothetical protein
MNRGIPLLPHLDLEGESFNFFKLLNCRRICELPNCVSSVQFVKINLLNNTLQQWRRGGRMYSNNLL